MRVAVVGASDSDTERDALLASQYEVSRVVPLRGADAVVVVLHVGAAVPKEVQCLSVPRYVYRAVL